MLHAKERKKKSNNRFKQTWTKMHETCHQKLQILFCEGNGSQTCSARGPIRIRPQILLILTETEKAS